MTIAFANARRLIADPLEFARIAVVVGCALALIAAGQALPF